MACNECLFWESWVSIYGIWTLECWSPLCVERPAKTGNVKTNCHGIGIVKLNRDEGAVTFEDNQKLALILLGTKTPSEPCSNCKKGIRIVKGRISTPYDDAFDLFPVAFPFPLPFPFPFAPPLSS